MDNSPGICNMCYRNLNTGALFTAACSHKFHYNCIMNNLQNGSHVCPTCYATWTHPSSTPPTYNPPFKYPVVRPPWDPNFSNVHFRDDDPLPLHEAPLPPQLESTMPTTAKGKCSFCNCIYDLQNGSHICPSCYASWTATWTRVPPSFTPPIYKPSFSYPTVRDPSDPTFSDVKFNDDDLLSTSEALLPPQQGSAMSMTVKAVPEYPAISKSDQSDSFAVLVSIRPPVLSSIDMAKSRAPLKEELSEEDKQVCLEVDREKNRISIAEGISEAQKMAARGELDEARTLLEQRRHSVKQSYAGKVEDMATMSLFGQANMVAQCMSSEQAYVGGGRAFAFSAQSSHQYQRAAAQMLQPVGQFMGFGAAATSAAPGGNAFGFQTPFMQQLVTKSQQERQFSNGQNQGTDGNSSVNP